MNSLRCCLFTASAALILFTALSQSSAQTTYAVDDFNDGDNLTLFGGNWGAVNDTIVTIESVPNELQYDGTLGGVLKLQYSGLSAARFAGLWLSYAGISDDRYASLEISRFDSISFYLRGSGQSQQTYSLKIELKDNTVDPKIAATKLAFRRIEFSDSKTQWTRCSFGTNILDFTSWRYGDDLPDVKRMRYLAIILEGDHNQSEGTFYLDQVEFIKKEVPPPIESTEDLLMALRRNCTQYFLDWYCEQNNLFYHRVPLSETFSPIATGYGLIALTIAAENGWLPRETCLGHSSQILNSLLQLVKSQKTSLETGFGGMLYQFLDLDGHRKDRKTHVEVKDYLLLLVGALINGAYFDGDIETLADSLWSRVDWPAFLYHTRNGRDQILSGWNPERTPEFTFRKDHYAGFFSGTEQYGPNSLNYYDDYLILASILSRGTPNENFRLRRDIFESWERVHAESGNYVQTWNGTLDDALLSHLFLDYRQLGLDKHRIPQWRIDWRSNAQQIARDHYDRSRKLNLWPEGSWGITSCETWSTTAPDSIIYEIFGIRPNGSGTENFNGTIAPHAVLVCLTLGDDLAEKGIVALTNYADTPDILSQRYGYYESYNAWKSNDFSTRKHNRVHLAAHVGQSMVALDNYITGKMGKEPGLIQTRFMLKLEDVLKELFFYNSSDFSRTPNNILVGYPSPNPFSSEVEVQYQILYPLPISIRIYNIQGQLIADLSENAYKESGKHAWNWQPSVSVANGIYFWSITYDNAVYTRKMVLIR